MADVEQPSIYPVHITRAVLVLYDGDVKVQTSEKQINPTWLGEKDSLTLTWDVKPKVSEA